MAVLVPCKFEDDFIKSGRYPLENIFSILSI